MTKETKDNLLTMLKIAFIVAWSAWGIVGCFRTLRSKTTSPVVNHYANEPQDPL